MQILDEAFVYYVIVLGHNGDDVIVILIALMITAIKQRRQRLNANLTLDFYTAALTLDYIENYGNTKTAKLKLGDTSNDITTIDVEFLC